MKSCNLIIVEVKITRNNALAFTFDFNPSQVNRVSLKRSYPIKNISFVTFARNKEMNKLFQLEKSTCDYLQFIPLRQQVVIYVKTHYF